MSYHCTRKKSLKKHTQTQTETERRKEEGKKKKQTERNSSNFPLIDHSSRI